MILACVPLTCGVFRVTHSSRLAIVCAKSSVLAMAPPAVVSQGGGLVQMPRANAGQRCIDSRAKKALALCARERMERWGVILSCLFPESKVLPRGPRLPNLIRFHLALRSKVCELRTSQHYQSQPNLHHSHALPTHPYNECHRCRFHCF